jgi:hypothetical protein
MKFSVTGKEKDDLLIQVTTWADLTVLKNKIISKYYIKISTSGTV